MHTEQSVPRFLESTGYLLQTQHSFRHARSCGTVLATPCHFVSNNLGSRKKKDFLRLHLSYAFDALNIDLLLHKMSGASVHGFLLKWLPN